MYDIILPTLIILVGLGTISVLLVRYIRRQSMANAASELESVAKRMKSCANDSSSCIPPPVDLKASTSSNDEDGSGVPRKRNTPVSLREMWRVETGD